MKALIVFYSLEGNTEKVANIIKKVAGENTQVVQLKPLKDLNKKGPMKFIVGGRQAMKEEGVALQPYEVDIDSANIIFIGTPIWAGKVTPAINTFIEEYDLMGKKLAFFFCSKSGNYSGALDALLPKLTRSQIIGEIGLKTSVVKSTEERELGVSAWAKEVIAKVTK